MKKQEFLREQTKNSLKKIVYKTEKGVTVGRKEHMSLKELVEVATYCDMPKAAMATENEILDWFGINYRYVSHASHFIGSPNVQEQFREKQIQDEIKGEVVLNALNIKMDKMEEDAKAKRKELDGKAADKRKELDDKAADKRKELDAKAAEKRKGK